MNRRTIILCSILAAILVIAAAAGMFFLFSDDSVSMEQHRDVEELSKSFYGIPSDAVMIMEFERFMECADAFGRKEFPPAIFNGSSVIPELIVSLQEAVQSQAGGETCEALNQSAVTISLHYSGRNRISPLVVITMPDDSMARTVSDAVKSKPFKVSTAANGNMAVISDSDVLLQSSLRHIGEGVSIMDNSDFVNIATGTAAGVNLFVNHINLGKLFSGCFNGSFLKYAAFFQDYSYWSSYTLRSVGDGFVNITGLNAYHIDTRNYAHVFDGLKPRSVTAWSMTPNFASVVISIPVNDIDKLTANIDRYFDGKGRLDKMQSYRNRLAEGRPDGPEQWVRRLDIQEVAAVRCKAGGSEQWINMFKCGKTDKMLLFNADTVDMKNYVPGITEFRYKEYAASIFGSLFSMCPEEYSTFMSGWLITGSREAIEEFVSGRSLELNLERYLYDAGLSDIIPSKSLMSVYVNLPQDPDGIAAPFKSALASTIKASTGEHSINVFTYCLKPMRNGMAYPEISQRLSDYEIPTVPKYERDTVVVIPQGPWKVKNSGTGRTNLMYQQKNMYICLTEENGKGIWSAPFSSPICGNIDQVDYFENGKLQMIFASGSKLYLIDRLGRMVHPFPVNLKKEILLGPEIYDFDDNRKYNAMVLHKDNTLGLYDLEGKLVDGWTGLQTDETIKCLPELLEVNSSRYWIVTTSLQTIICDFYGKPVADFSGSKKMRPGTEIVKISGDDVEVETYDAKKWRLNLKTGKFSKR